MWIHPGRQVRTPESPTGVLWVPRPLHKTSLDHAQARSTCTKDRPNKTSSFDRPRRASIPGAPTQTQPRRRPGSPSARSARSTTRGDHEHAADRIDGRSHNGNLPNAHRRCRSPDTKRVHTSAWLIDQGTGTCRHRHRSLVQVNLPGPRAPHHDT